MIKKCINCGIDFTPDNHKWKTCSNECRAKRQLQSSRRYYSKNNVKKTHKEKECFVCGEKFTPRNVIQIACKKCSRGLSGYKRMLKIKQNFKEEKKECKNCGLVFNKKRDSGKKQVYCSRECGTKYHNTNKPSRSMGVNKKHKTVEAAKKAYEEQRKAWYVNNKEKVKKRSAEYYKKPARKEAIALYRFFGTSKVAKSIKKQYSLIKLGNVISRGDENKEDLIKILNRIEKGETYAAYE